jgi:hypothetical protein
MASAPAHAPALRTPRPAIVPERLESCLRRLEPDDRALLDLSLNRGIPDWAMAPIVKTDPISLAWKRARAIERVASRLGLTHPADLADVRAALIALPDRAWLPLELQAAPEPPLLIPPEPARTEISIARAEPRPVRQRLQVTRRPGFRRQAKRAAGALAVGAFAALALRRR